jgi:tetratricopeptide (TPR) repeat protein
MPRKQVVSAQRLRKHIEIETDPLANALGLVNDAALQGAAYKAAQKFRETDWDDVAQRSLAAHHALSLDDLDKPLKKAFKAFGLDPRNPFHWRKLLAYFCDVHFDPRQRRRGPQKLWSDGRLCQLLQDFDRIKRQLLVPGSKIGDLELCERLKRHSSLGKAYAEFSAKTVLRNLQRARNPTENCLLGEMVATVAEPIIAKLRAAAKKAGIVLDQKREREVRSRALKQVIKVISSGWRKRPEQRAMDDRTRGKSLMSERRAGLGY